MSDLKAIKKRILREDKLEQIYEALGCEYISQRNNRIEAGLPPHFNSDNKRSVQTKFNDSLTSSIRNRGDFKGDIFFLVSYILNGVRGESELFKDLPNAKAFICETLGWREYLQGGDYESRVDYLAPLKAIIKGKQRRREIKPNPTIPDSVLKEYLPYPSYDWLVEGISLKTQMEYGVRFDVESKRIVLPMHNRFGQLIGVKGRILKDQDDDRKYMYLHPFNNSYEFFNLHRALPHILLEKKVYLFEGEKSCMKMDQAGRKNSLAIGSSDLTDIQANIVKQLGIDIEVVLCYDTDMFPDDVKEALKKDPKKLPDIVKNAVKLFTGRKVYAIIDMQGSLSNKCSPIDAGIDRFNELEKGNCYHITPEMVE